MKKNYAKHLLSLGLLGVFIYLAVGSGSSDSSYSFVKNPVDDMIRDLSHYTDYSIILYDMDYKEKQDKYFHQYRVLKGSNNKQTAEQKGIDSLQAIYKKLEDPSLPSDEQDKLWKEVRRLSTKYASTGATSTQNTDFDTLTEDITGWLEVPPTYFQEHVNDMGMIIAMKKNGVLEKKTIPPGYQYVGNEKYGRWKEGSDGNRFWEFYGRYAFMSSMFRLATMPIYYSMWNDWHGNYYPYGRRYYGGNYYGTSGRYARNTAKRSWNSKPTTFKNKVRKRVKLSSNKYKTSRSSSRYGSSSRSRGGGFGK